MAFRKLTSEFLRLRGENKHRSSASSGSKRRSSSFNSTANNNLLGGGSDVADSSAWEQARHTLPPYWVDTVDEINSNLEQMQTKMEQLEGVHRRRLMAFDDDEQQRHEREIDILTKDITSKFQKSERSLKRILATNSKPGNTDERVRRNIQRSLATRLQELSGEFRRAQRGYLSKLQKKKKETAGDGFGGDGGGSGLDAMDVDPGFTGMQQEMIRANVDDIDQRDKEIMEIAKSIEELAVVFKELAVLVIDQGTILDRIDYNMEVAVDRVDQGVVQLERARKYQKASRPIRCICCLVIIIIVLTIMLIVKYQGRNAQNNDNNNGNSNSGRRLLSVASTSLFPQSQRLLGEDNWVAVPF